MDTEPMAAPPAHAMDPPRAAAGRAALAPLAAAAGIAALGALFAGVSTGDFVQHLDRQVHSIHCSFIPGAGPEMGESGCRAVMLSPYSSWFRTSLWGGVPISLWALAVFSFLAFRSAWLAWKGEVHKGETVFLIAAWGLPVGMSLVYGYLAMAEVGATCKVCVGMYGSSAAGLVAAILAHRAAGPEQDPENRARSWGGWFAQGVGYVAALTAVYLMFVPKPAAGAKGCGTLVQEEDAAGVMFPLAKGGSVPAIEVLDPLCPSCKAFSSRLAASGFEGRLALKGVLFPLDSSCNWMVTEALHPGACAVSEAILCAGPLSKEKDAASQARGANRVLTWAFAHQEELRTQAAKDEKKVRERLEREFPEVKGCLGGAVVKNKLVKSLRWGVANAIPVLTPQLFVEKTRVCDEDTDLGLEYTLARLLDGRGRGRGPAARGGAR